MRIKNKIANATLHFSALQPNQRNRRRSRNAIKYAEIHRGYVYLFSSSSPQYKYNIPHHASVSSVVYKRRAFLAILQAFSTDCPRESHLSVMYTPSLAALFLAKNRARSRERERE